MEEIGVQISLTERLVKKTKNKLAEMDTGCGWEKREWQRKQLG